MASKCFIINEWLLHDLRGDNGLEAQKQSFEFLKILKKKCDRIAIVSDSPWLIKAYELMEHRDILIRKLSKFLHTAILRDSTKFTLLERFDITNLPSEVKTLVSEEDLYLIESYFLTDANAIVTTDNKLYEVLSTSQSVKIRLRDGFLKEYLRRV